jgi:hypothetical protein
MEPPALLFVLSDRRFTAPGVSKNVRWNKRGTGAALLSSGALAEGARFNIREKRKF